MGQAPAMIICVIVASEQKNLDLAESFKICLQGLGAEVQLLNLVDLDLPLYSSRCEGKYQGQVLLKESLERMAPAKGLVFIAPEYNGSTPPVFNNFLAWLSRSSKNWREYLNGRPAALATFSGGGGAHVLLAMRTQLSFIGMNVIGRQILAHSQKPLDPISLKSVCEELLKLARAQG